MLISHIDARLSRFSLVWTRLWDGHRFGRGQTETMATSCFDNSSRGARGGRVEEKLDCRSRSQCWGTYSAPALRSPPVNSGVRWTEMPLNPFTTQLTTSGTLADGNKAPSPQKRGLQVVYCGSHVTFTITLNRKDKDRHVLYRRKPPNFVWKKIA